MQETWVQSLGWEDSPGEENGNPLQYSCLENPMGRVAWRATVHGVTESDMTKHSIVGHVRELDVIIGAMTV